MELSEYSKSSSFVQQFAIEGDGLDESHCGSEVIDSSKRVVLFDALLRRHYMPITAEDLDDLTDFGEYFIQDVLLQFEEVGFVVAVEEARYELNTDNDCVCELRDLQKELMGR